MYPYRTDRVFVRDCWYVAALAREIGETPFERRILDDPVLLYRTTEGRAVALHGLCPHRRLPLRLGTRCGDDIRCGYHGMEFGPDGACTRTPSQERPAEAMRVRAYPLVERGGFAWIWPGDPASADPALIPDHEEMGLGEGWVQSPFEVYHVAARHALMVDNLLDLSHISYLHGAYIEDDAWTRTPVTMRREGSSWVASRRTAQGAVSGFNRWMFPDIGDVVGQDLRTVFVSPAMIYSGPVVHEVEPDGKPPRYRGTMTAVHALTPETARSTHYFSASTRDFRLDDTGMTDELHGMDVAVRMQDVNALGLIECELADEARLPPEISVRADTPGLQIRRAIEDLLMAEERAEAAAPAPVPGDPAG